jgi:ribosomal protein S21
MITIDCSSKKLETCLKQYRQKVDKIGQIGELKDRKYFEKPSQRRRKTKNLAKYRLRVNGSPKI